MQFARLAAALVMPLPLCLGLLAAGVVLLWWGRRPRLGRALVTAGTGLLTALSLGPVADAIVGPLEGRHPPLAAPPDGEPVKWVVVLGNGYRPDPAVPATARLPRTGLVRLAEGVRVHRLLPGSRLLVLIGGATGDDGREETVRELGAAFGIAPADLEIDATGRTTADEVAAIRGRVGDARFVLVTSAAHMPRAVGLCEAASLRPIPAPTDHEVVASEYGVLHALPSPDHLRQNGAAAHEAIGWLWRLVGG